MNLTPEITMSFSKKSKDRKDENPPTDCLAVDMEKVGLKAAVVQETAETVAKVVVTTYALKKLIDTTCEIALIVAKARFK